MLMPKKGLRPLLQMTLHVCPPPTLPLLAILSTDSAAVYSYHDQPLYTYVLGLSLSVLKWHQPIDFQNTGKPLSTIDS